MKAVRTLAALLLLIIPQLSNGQIHWLTDFSDAQQTAATTDKNILLSFSGSDWCGNCMRLEKTLFQSDEFASFSNKHFVLVNADFPMKKKNKLSAELTAHNEALAEKYNPSGVFPLVLVLKPDGSVIGKLKTPEDSAAAYIKSLNDIIR